jgi:hypothetical protein
MTTFVERKQVSAAGSMCVITSGGRKDRNLWPRTVVGALPQVDLAILG